MKPDITDIDHLMVSAAKGAQAAEMFSKMGFTLTPRGRLPGLSNRLICFSGDGEAPNFVELMSLDDAKAAPPAMVAGLKGPDRPVLLVAATADAAAARAVLSDAGFELSAVIEGARDWRLPSGETIALAFSIVLPNVGQAPFYWILCQHKTPQHYLRRDFTRHDNGATALSQIIAVAQDPVSAARHYERYWAATLTIPPSAAGSDAPVIATRGRVELHIYAYESFRSRFPGIGLQHPGDHIVGFAVKIGSAPTLCEILKKNGFRPEMMGANVVLDPSQACGCLVVFETVTAPESGDS